MNYSCLLMNYYILYIIEYIQYSILYMYCILGTYWEEGKGGIPCPSRFIAIYSESMSVG